MKRSARLAVTIIVVQAVLIGVYWLVDPQRRPERTEHATLGTGPRHVWILRCLALRFTNAMVTAWTSVHSSGQRSCISGRRGVLHAVWSFPASSRCRVNVLSTRELSHSMTTGSPATSIPVGFCADGQCCRPTGPRRFVTVPATPEWPTGSQPSDSRPAMQRFPESKAWHEKCSLPVETKEDS